MLPTSGLILFLACSNYFDFTLQRKKKSQVLLTEHMQVILNFSIEYINLNYYQLFKNYANVLI